ncbi:coilin-like isoform X1 [Cynara cardunculus var. scolymus]|uniref:coilin-like isoform X1 n=1 Tax=Cynara cardunculus var. scolymus TaxID=59895 RepID=UPI000D62B482|nr:coilin-like isoform X1 [Cynara cardunculus var. scolymus]
METPSLRVRLVFEDRSILSKTQRSDGMDHSWFLLKSQQHRTISDVCTHLLHIFKLRRSCPNGILLSMDGFVLPSFESTEMLKDKEIICVRKKGGDAVEAADAGNLLDKVEVDGLDSEDDGLLLLANDTFDKETGEYQSESEEVDEEQLQDEASPDAVSNKRKASMKLQNSTKKRRRLGVLDDAEDEADAEEIDNVNIDTSHSRKISRKGKLPNRNSKPNEETNRSAATSNKKVKSPSIVKRSEQLQQNIEEVNQVSTAPGAKKIPSRSARRKKAKREWMKELAKISKKKPYSYSKPEVTKAENEEANGRPKGLLHWKQAPNKSVHKNTIDQDAGTGVVSIVTRPGHIRFEPLDEDQTPKQTRVSNETLMWNGSSSKRKGKKWSTERFSASRRNDSKRINKEAFKMLFTDAQVPVIDPNDFDKLPPCCSPKEGDVIAYRLLELSSSWIPEFSSFRVGRISYYDARDIVLIPVPEYPIASDKINEDGPNDSLYGEDGTLEINYSALVDVRNLKQYDPDAIEAVSNGVNQTLMSDDKNDAEKMVSNSNDNNMNLSKDSNPGDGEVNPWDRFSKVNSLNAEMSEPNHSSMVITEMNPCSYGAAGPRVAPDANNAESSEKKDEQKGSSSGNPWLNANKQAPSQENGSSLAGWTDAKQAGPSENDNEKGSSWGRPWSSFVISRASPMKEQNKENDWNRGSSRGNGQPWSRGAPRGRGRGRGFGSGRGRGNGRGRGRG